MVRVSERTTLVDAGGGVRVRELKKAHGTRMSEKMFGDDGESALPGAAMPRMRPPGIFERVNGWVTRVVRAWNEIDPGKLEDDEDDDGRSVHCVYGITALAAGTLTPLPVPTAPPPTSADSDDDDESGNSDDDDDDDDRPRHRADRHGHQRRPEHVSDRVPASEWLVHVLGMPEAEFRRLRDDDLSAAIHAATAGGDPGTDVSTGSTGLVVVNRRTSEEFCAGRVMTAPLSTFTSLLTPPSGAMFARLQVIVPSHGSDGLSTAALLANPPWPDALFQVETGFNALPVEWADTAGMATSSVAFPLDAGRVDGQPLTQLLPRSRTGKALIPPHVATAAATVVRAYAAHYSAITPTAPPSAWRQSGKNQICMLASDVFQHHLQVVDGAVLVKPGDTGFPRSAAERDNLAQLYQAVWQQGCQVTFSGIAGQGGSLELAPSGRFVDLVFGAAVGEAYNRRDLDARPADDLVAFFLEVAYAAAYAVAMHLRHETLVLTLLGSSPAQALYAIQHAHMKYTSSCVCSIRRVVISFDSQRPAPAELDSWLSVMASQGIGFSKCEASDTATITPVFEVGPHLAPLGDAGCIVGDSSSSSSAQTSIRGSTV